MSNAANCVGFGFFEYGPIKEKIEQLLQQNAGTSMAEHIRMLYDQTDFTDFLDVYELFGEVMRMQSF